MTDITEFIRARLDEDEAAAREDKHPDIGDYRLGVWLIDWGEMGISTARVLAQVAAMRAIVDLHRPEEHVDREGLIQCDHCARLCHSETGLMCEQDPCDAPFPCPTLRHLAAIWSSHPDYDPAWAPDAQT